MTQSLLELAYNLYYPEAEFRMGKRTFNTVKTKLKAAGYRYVNAGERAVNRGSKPPQRKPRRRRTPDENFALGVAGRVRKDIGGGLRKLNPFRKK